MCSCTGEITYAPELFDGEVYTVPSAERAYKVPSYTASLNASLLVYLIFCEVVCFVNALKEWLPM